MRKGEEREGEKEGERDGMRTVPIHPYRRITYSLSTRPPLAVDWLLSSVPVVLCRRTGKSMHNR